jgi:hypothetical protein
VQLTRELLKLQNKNNAMATRFSILSTAMLRRVHSAFTPEELITTKLLCYNQPLFLKKARSGRHFDSPPDSNLTIDGSTIACMSGFIVNMVTQKIKLISPCAASAKRPLGYKVFFEGTFKDENHFSQIIREVISDYILSDLENDKILKLRSDLEYGYTEDGICFHSKHKKTTFSGYGFLKEMGDMIASGKMNAKQINENLLASGADFVAVIAMMQSIFQNGLLEEVDVV